jgi:hypothetical protein
VDEFADEVWVGVVSRLSVLRFFYSGADLDSFWRLGLCLNLVNVEERAC